MNQKSLILAMLRKGPALTNHFEYASDIRGRWNARIDELRGKGYDIQKTWYGKGQFEYKLVSERCGRCEGSGDIQCEANVAFLGCPACYGSGRIYHNGQQRLL